MTTDNTANEPGADDEASSVEAHAVTDGPSGIDPVEPADLEAAAPAEEAPVEITSVEAAPLAAAPAAGDIVLEDDDRDDADDRDDDDDDDDDGDDKKSAKEETIEIAKTIFYALLIALVLRVLLFQPFTIPSASMEPNLYEGDYIIVSKWDYGYSKHSIPLSPGIFSGRLFANEPRRGDIAVFKLPRDNKTDYIKRVIGLPGDRIQMRDGVLFINGEMVKKERIEDYVDGEVMGEGGGHPIQQYEETLPNGVKYRVLDQVPNGSADNTIEYVVPPAHYFMMGDNRDNSEDSRFLDVVGYVPIENYVGRADIIFFSISRGTTLWEVWKWPFEIRWGRFLNLL